MKNIICIFICITVLFSLTLGQENVLDDHERQRFHQQMKDSLASINTLQASFLQERQMAFFMEPLQSSGRLFFQQPDLLRWEILGRYHSILIFADKTVAKFEVRDDRIRRLDNSAADMMSRIMEQIVFWMKGDFSGTEDLYQLQVYYNNGYIVELVPKSEALRKSIRRILLTVSQRNYHVRSVKIEESETDFIDIRFRDEVINQELSREIFDLNKPFLPEEKN